MDAKEAVVYALSAINDTEYRPLCNEDTIVRIVLSDGSTMAISGNPAYQWLSYGPITLRMKGIIRYECDDIYVTFRETCDPGYISNWNVATPIDSVTEVSLSFQGLNWKTVYRRDEE